jgi:hypothetical protein
MTKMQVRAALPMAIGLGLGMLAAGMRLGEPGASPLLYLAPALAAGAGFILLHKWREMAGLEESGPLLTYIAVIAGAYILFGMVYTPQQRTLPMAAVMAVAMILPALFELVFDHGKFKAKEEPASNLAQPIED